MTRQLTSNNYQFSIKRQMSVEWGEYCQSGQTLVLLLVFVMIAIAITTAAAFVISTNSLAATNVSQGEVARQMAESGAEKALLGLVRDPNYKGESFSLNGGTVTSTVSGTLNLIIDSTATNSGYTRRVEVTATYSNNVLTPVTWKDLN